MKAKRNEELRRMLVCLGIFVLFQFVFCICALYNRRLYDFLGLALIPWVMGIAGMAFVSMKKGNVKIVLYASLLLSIGQLVQTILQEGAEYEAYRDRFQMFCLAAAAAAVIFWILYGRLYPWLEKTAVKIILGAGCVGILLVLQIFGDSNGRDASLWINLGGISIQPSEFLKPIFVALMAGMLCGKKKLSDNIQAGAFLFTGFLAVSLSAFFNEFGTGMLIGLTGITMIYIFQNSRVSRALATLIIGGVVAAGLFFIMGNKIYEAIPEECYAKEEKGGNYFDNHFAATGNKKELIAYLSGQIEKTDKGELIKKEEALGFSYAEAAVFLKNEITDAEIDSCYDEFPADAKDEKKFSKRQIQYRQYIEKLSGDINFRRYFESRFIDKKIYVNRMKTAYLSCRGSEAALTMEEKEASLGTKEKLGYEFFKVYLRTAEKLQGKISGFLHPEEGAQGTEHINQSISAIAGGGFFGNGPQINKGRGFFAAKSDMVFSMVVSELGCLAGILVIILNLLILKEAVQISLETQSLYQKGIAAGLGICWVWQAGIIVAGSCRWLPFAGITLPLISEGGTSLVVSLLTIVLLVLISVKPMTWKLQRAGEPEAGSKRHVKRHKDREIRDSKVTDKNITDETAGESDREWEPQDKTAQYTGRGTQYWNREQDEEKAEEILCEEPDDSVDEEEAIVGFFDDI